MRLLETVLSVARWSVDERRCCPFFTFVIEREPAPGCAVGTGPRAGWREGSAGGDAYDDRSVKRPP